MLAALLAVASASVASCNIGAACSGSNCDGSLSIYFDGDWTGGEGAFDGGTVDGGAPADAIEIDIAAQIDQTSMTIQTCWLTLDGQRRVVCDSPQGGTYLLDGPLQFSGSNVRMLTVTMSMNGTQLSQQTISPTYATQICGCGLTTSIGTAHVELPSP
jgi:hypothetical protein